jgi:lysophospholipase L1-like esterase
VSRPTPEFDYSNLSGRPLGPFLQLMSTVLSGVRQVQDQVRPYAEAWRAANLQALADSGPLWVALGDSMTQGVGASTFDRGWVGQLARRLDDEGRHHRVVNLAFSGARTTDVLDRQLPALAALATPPDLVTVLIGSNDLTRRAYRDRLPAAFAELLERLPVGSVVANLPQPRSAARRVNVLIERAVRQRGLVLADMLDRRHAPTSWRGRLAEDHFHPNELGYAGLADTFHHAIGHDEAERSRQAPI